MCSNKYNIGIFVRKICHMCNFTYMLRETNRRKHNTQHTPKKSSQNCCQMITKSTDVAPK